MKSPLDTKDREREQGPKGGWPSLCVLRFRVERFRVGHKFTISCRTFRRQKTNVLNKSDSAEARLLTPLLHAGAGGEVKSPSPQVARVVFSSSPLPYYPKQPVSCAPMAPLCVF